MTIKHENDEDGYCSDHECEVIYNENKEVYEDILLENIMKELEIKLDITPKPDCELDKYIQSHNIHDEVPKNLLPNKYHFIVEEMTKSYYSNCCKFDSSVIPEKFNNYDYQIHANNYLLEKIIILKK
jgi:hypothetical protein